MRGMESFIKLLPLACLAHKWLKLSLIQLAPIAEESCLHYGGYQSDNIVIFLVNLQKPFI